MFRGLCLSRVLNRSVTPCLGLEVFEVSNSRRCCTHGSTVFAPVVRGEDPDREAALRTASEHPADRGEDRPGQVHREPRAEARLVVRVQRERVVPALPAETAEDRAVDLGTVLFGAGRAEKGRPASARVQETASHGFGVFLQIGVHSMGTIFQQYEVVTFSWTSWPGGAPPLMAKYSKEQRDRAVDLYIRYERCAADVIHELGYPSRGMLPVWYRERLEEERTGRQSTRGKRYRRYTDEQKQAAVDHYLGHGRRLRRAMRALGYPKSHELLTAWIDELAPGRRKLRHGPVPEELKRKAVVAVASGRLKSREAAAELGVEASVVGKPETADARRIQGDARDEDAWREAPDGRGGENRRGALYAGGHAAGRRRPAGRGRPGGRGGGAGEEAGGDACPSGRAGRRRRSAAAGEEGTGHRDRDPEGRDRAVGKRAGRSPGKPGQPREDDPRQDR